MTERPKEHTPQESQSAVKRILRFIIFALGLGICGIIFGIIGILIGAKLGTDSAGFAGLGLAIAGLIVGYPVGIVIGIIQLRKVFHQNGSMLFGIIGSVIGAVLTIGLAEPLNINASPDILFASFFVIVPVLGLAGFYLKKRPSK